AGELIGLPAPCMQGGMRRGGTGGTPNRGTLTPRLQPTHDCNNLFAAGALVHAGSAWGRLDTNHYNLSGSDEKSVEEGRSGSNTGPAVFRLTLAGPRLLGVGFLRTRAGWRIWGARGAESLPPVDVQPGSPRGWIASPARRAAWRSSSPGRDRSVAWGHNHRGR